MLPIKEHRTLPETADVVVEPDGTGSVASGLVVGDLGVVVLRALLENGVGYVVSSWRDRPTPIDAAIDDARERVLIPRGVVLRRLRSLAALEPIVTAPAGGITGTPPRGLVVFAGRRGLRPVLERFLAVRASGAVVGICFDDDALRIEDALVIDPEPTAVGVVRAIDEAFTASVSAGRPALVVVRERTLGMRGALRMRPDRSPIEAAADDVMARAQGPECSVASAAERAGLVTVVGGLVDVVAGTPRPVLVMCGPLLQAAERALAQVAATLAQAGARPVADLVALVSTRCPGVVPEIGGAAAAALAGSTAACVVAARAPRVAERLRTLTAHGRVSAHVLDPGTARGEQLVGIVASWLLESTEGLDPATRTVLEALAQAQPGPSVPAVRATGRVPRRSEMLHRAVPPAVAAGLALAQGVIGVPGRLDVEFPTYRTDTGVALTIVPAALFATHGASSAAPGTGAGVFLVTHPDVNVAGAAAAAGASIEHVDGGSPRAIGAAIGRACRATRGSSHVIVVADVQRVASPRTATFGMDPDLVGTERLATAAVPADATLLVELGDDLLAGPSVLALDVPAAHAALHPLRELSPATWDLRATRRDTRGSRLGWKLRRRIVRSAAGLDL